MRARQLMCGLACAAVLAGCAVNPPEPAGPAPLAVLLNKADADLKAGRNGQALRLLQEATRDYPAEKMPWLRLAQLRYEANNYGEAIAAAQQVLARDGDDTLAHSILAVSGLRVASRALADLREKNHIAGNPKAEAQELARLLRSALGEDKLVPGR